MPILHAQLGGAGKTANGKTVQVHPAFALHQRGPIVPVTITIEQNAGKGLLAQGKTPTVP
jgi:hypothetical protein